MNRTVEEVLAAVDESVGDSFDEPVTSVRSERIGGDTALHIVAKWGDVEAVRLLVKAGASIDKPGEDDNTPLHYAAMVGRLEAAQCLVELGAKSLKDRYGNTPSQLVSNNDELRSFLVKHGF